MKNAYMLLVAILTMGNNIFSAAVYRNPSNQPQFKSTYKEFMEATFGPIQNRRDDRLPYWSGINKDGSISMIFAQKDTLGKKGGYDKYKWYLSNIATDGKMKLKNKYLDNINSPFESQRSFGKTSMILSDGNVLMVTFPAVSIAIFDPIQGVIIENKTLNKLYESGYYRLFDDPAGNIYLKHDNSGYPYYMKVYPLVDSSNAVDIEMPLVSANYHWNSTLAVTGSNNIIVCFRAKENIDLTEKLAENGCGYFVTNFKNEIVKPKTNFNYVEYAFRKIPNVYLPHASMYNNKGKNELLYDIREGMDFYRLPDGQMILTITAFEKDHSLCLYQVKFDSNGELIKPGKMAVSTAITNLSKQYLQNIQTGISVKHFYKGSILNNANRLLVREQVFWGYDDDGQLYWDCVPLDTLQVK